MQIIGKPVGFDVATDVAWAEQRGYDGVRLIDHFGVPMPDGSVRGVPHSIAVLGAAAALSTNLILTQTMMCVNFRNPGELAHAIATIDHISGGRAELGLGAGWYRAEHHAYGYDFPGHGERIARACEAAVIIRRMLRDRGRAAFAGAHYTVDATIEWPATPHVPAVVMGGAGPRTLARAAEVADRVDVVHAQRSGVPVLDEAHASSQEALAERCRIIRNAAARAGNSIRMSATVFGALVDSPSEAASTRAAVAKRCGCEPDRLEVDLLYSVRTGDQFLVAVQDLANLGFDRVNFAAIPEGGERTYRMLDEMVSDIHGITPEN